jgi:tRNA pseudouridine synthase 10
MKIDNICDLKIVQLTPLRVLHRRTLMIRNKRIYEMRCVLINKYIMMVYINSSSGTYIK